MSNENKILNRDKNYWVEVHKSYGVMIKYDDIYRLYYKNK